MDYEKTMPAILANQVLKNPKGYFSRIRLSHRRVLKWIQAQTSSMDLSASFGERVYWIIHGLKEHPLCEECHLKRKKFHNVVQGYSKFCSLKCAGRNKDFIQKRLATSERHFGKGNMNNREKARRTCKKLYGEELYMNTQDFKDAKQKFLDDNNVENSFLILDVIEKSLATKRRRYGEHFEKIAEKQRDTVSRFSCEKRKDIEDKRISTYNELYNVDYAFQATSVKDKIKATNRDVYGTSHPMQSALFRRAVLGRKYAYDSKSFDSSDELAFYICLTDLHVDFDFLPDAGFSYLFDGRDKMYFPDFRVNSIYIELKGDHFFKDDGTMQNPFDHSLDELYEAKHQCMIQNNVVIIKTSSKLMKLVKAYINEKYGKSYLRSFKT